MASFWKNLIDLFLPPPKGNKDRKNANNVSWAKLKYQQRQSGYPNTFDPIADRNSSGRPEIFDPSLLQFSRAFRQGDPHFSDAVLYQKWIETRRQVIDHLLGIITNSKWNEHLVLRGSLLLKAWLGEDAREPGDIDWVFRPKNVGVSDRSAVRLFVDLKQKIAENPAAGNAVIDAAKIVTDDIWTYERAAGKRIIFPWQAESLPGGFVQMDVVFKEDLWTEPVQTQIPTCQNSSRLVWTVDKEISLAWKLLWLETDDYPQGKDLYDATLLAEQTYLPLSLLKLVLQSADWRPRGEELPPDFPLQWEVDWDNFKLEYPWITGTAEEWQSRLAEALKASFENLK